MIDRYSTKRMKKLWSNENKFNTYLKVELSTLDAFVKLGKIPKKDVEIIKKNAKVDLKRIYEIEEETKHDVIAFTRSISEKLKEEKKWVHYGLTSTDVVDTSYGLLIKESNEYIEESLNKFIKVLKEKALKYKKTPIMGRTHGIHAEITSFGLKWALYYDEMVRNINRFNNARKEIEIGKISGAVGNFANTPPEVQDLVCKSLNIESSNISTQTLQRDRHANYIFVLSLITTTLEKIAIEIRNLQKTEVGELQEGFSKNQKGSSAMPHKKNPIASENITGIARVMRGYVIPAMENVSLWHERDISHSSVERIIFPDALNLVDYALTRFTNVIDNLIVNEEKMKKNIWITNGIVFSQQVLNKLIKKGLSREDSYDKVQKLSFHSWKNNLNFKEILEKDDFINKYLSKNEINECFDINYYLKNVDKIYKRVFK